MIEWYFLIRVIGQAHMDGWKQRQRMKYKSLGLHPCIDCGSPALVVTTLIRTDVHGCRTQEAMWSECDYCGISRVISPIDELEGCMHEADDDADRRGLPRGEPGAPEESR